jgi:hypothetical protein
MATAPDGAIRPVCFTYPLSALRNRNKFFCGSGPIQSAEAKRLCGLPLVIRF